MRNDILIRRSRVGRVDDVLILASGEKTVPGPMESTIRSCPFVNEAVMFGRERNQVGVLVQPQYEFDVNDEAALAEFRNKIWCVTHNISYVPNISIRTIVPSGLPSRRRTKTHQPSAESSRR